MQPELLSMGPLGRRTIIWTPHIKALCDFSFFTGGAAWEDVWRLHLKSSKHRTSENTSTNSTITGLAASWSCKETLQNGQQGKEGTYSTNQTINITSDTQPCTQLEKKNKFPQTRLQYLVLQTKLIFKCFCLEDRCNKHAKKKHIMRILCWYDMKSFKLTSMKDSRSHVLITIIYCIQRSF